MLEQINLDEKNNKKVLPQLSSIKTHTVKEAKSNNEKKQKNETNLIIGELDTSEKLSTCIGREIKLAVNSEEVKLSHYSAFGKKT